MSEMNAVFEQVMAQCARGCFTGLLKVRTREGSGEVRFLSGIQDGVRFASMEGDAALEKLQTAREHEFEAIASLPPIDLNSTDPVPPEGGLDRFHAAQLMRYCESNSLTCALELEANGKVLTARYRLGELLSVEPDSEHTAEMAEAKRGLYRFKLPKFELPAGAARTSAAPRSVANGHVESPASRAGRPPASAAQPPASTNGAPASVAKPAPASVAKPAVVATPAAAPVAAKPAAAAAPAAAKPSPVGQKISPMAPIAISAPKAPAVEPAPASAAASARGAARPAADSAALGASARSPLAAPSVHVEHPREPAKPQPSPAAAHAERAAPESPRAAPAAAAPAAQAKPAAARAEAPAVAARAASSREEPARSPVGKVARSRPREEREPVESEAPSSSRHWVILAVAVAAAAAGWFALGGSIP